MKQVFGVEDSAMNDQTLAAFAWRIILFGLLTGIGGGVACHHKEEAPVAGQDMKQQVSGSWMAGKPHKSASVAKLTLNPDGTFNYDFQVDKDPALKLSGDWAIDGASIVGQVKAVESGDFPVGIKFPFGNIVEVTEDTMTLEKDGGTDVYHRHDPSKDKAGR
jgi:hypothetical protein